VFQTSTALDSRLRQLALFMISSPEELAAVAEEQPARQGVAPLAAIELELGLAA
jgi:hypothetical protein